MSDKQSMGTAAPRRESDLRAVEQLVKARRLLLQEIHKVIIGQDDVIDQFLIAMC